MMISANEKERIQELVVEAEKRSRGELVPMVVRRSDLYPAAHFRGALITSFLFSLALYFSPLAILNPLYFLWIQIPGLAVGYLLAYTPWLTRLLITQKEIEEEVTQRATQAFFEHDLHATREHIGVLIFISMMERKIKIICDKGIRQKIDQKIWDEIVHAFTDHMATHSLAHALEEAVISTSSVLEKHFPRSEGAKKDELKNEVIIE